MTSKIQESFKKRKIALRKFNDYFNSFIDEYEEEILKSRKDIRTLIEEIRDYNRLLADVDDLYDEELVERFNSQAHRLSKFLNESTIDDDNNGTDRQTEEKQQQQKSKEIESKEIPQVPKSKKPMEPKIVENNTRMMMNNNNDDHHQQSTSRSSTSLNSNFIQLTDTNWSDYYPLMMEFIVTDQKIPDERTRIALLKKSVEKNSTASQLIANENSMRNAVKILRKEFHHQTYEQKESSVNDMILRFNFNTNAKNDEHNFRQLFSILLNIKFNVREEFRPRYYDSLWGKLPRRFRYLSMERFVRLTKEKLKFFNALPCLLDFKREEFIDQQIVVNHRQRQINNNTDNESNEKLDQLIQRLIDDKQLCPICFQIKKHLRSHSIVRCRNLNAFCRQYGFDDNFDVGGNRMKNLSNSMLNLSLDSTSPSTVEIWANHSNQIENNNNKQNNGNMNGFRYLKVNEKKKTLEFVNTDRYKSSNGNQQQQQRFGFSSRKSTNNPNKFVFPEDSQSSSSSISNNNNDGKNKKFIPIILIGNSKQQSFYRINASTFIDDNPNGHDDAMIENNFLKSLKISDANIEYKPFTDLRKIHYIIGHVEFDVNIGFVIRTIKFAIFSRQNTEPDVLISPKILQEFSIIIPSSSPTISKFEQRFVEIVDRSIDGNNSNKNGNFVYDNEKRQISIAGLLQLKVIHLDDDDDVLDDDEKNESTNLNDKEKSESLKNEILKNLLATKLLIKSSNIESSLRISFNEQNDGGDYYFVNQDDRIYFDFDLAIEEYSTKLKKFKKAYIYLLKGKNSKQFSDTMLIKFDQKKFQIFIQLPNDDEQKQKEFVSNIIQKCRQLA
ncbi:uncharacterized protein LOC113798142 isoform X1 [Dermatophagoides pteronyssinus]|uniref:uncharacterized protein LOC113798142 isoform X1 n=1 Tax=Dermatophagoides pteronyssinus TaxID=6956 RepID=UPI003F678D1C